MKERYNSKTKQFSNKKAITLTPIFVILLCIFLYAIFVKPKIELYTWELSSAQQEGPPFITVAHNKDYDFTDEDDALFKFSKPIELTCVAKNRKLTIADKTNNKVYNGTYKVKSWGRHHTPQSYEIVIDGKIGTANISNNSLLNRTLFMSIDGYNLNFVIK